MTENEAIRVFKEPTKHIKKSMLDGEQTICYSTDMVKAFETAILALTDIQAYRAIGTVEDCEHSIHSAKVNYEMMNEYKHRLDMFEEICTIEECRVAIEKMNLHKSENTYDENGFSDYWEEN